MKKHLEKIREMMGRVNMDCVDFMWHHNKPTIQKDGLRYEILCIYAPEDDGTITLAVIPRYNWKLEHLTMTDKWRESSWRHVSKIVGREVARMEAGW